MRKVQLLMCSSLPQGYCTLYTTLLLSDLDYGTANSDLDLEVVGEQLDSQLVMLKSGVVPQVPVT